ncbi:hypothetical protein CCACVL1_04281 [Corchorus capsularis]|uniref:Uncharacterized protein n=1 Tax=Corchorus capsularis TaxID=210143 RepID=A0A1R3JTY0_COCAP|nr:hypothetical protein CCACVL1_04281 [Corchorus capsularis]
MGCFLACFGSSKNRKARKNRHKVRPRFQRNASCNAQSTVSLEQSISNLEKPISPVKEVRDDKAEEQLGSASSSNTRKKVTFDTNVKTYEHDLVNESIDFELRNDEEEGEKEGKVKEEKLAKPREFETSFGSENSSIASTSSSYPPNHRYQNCRESDDEEDELDYAEESDLDDDDEDDDCEKFDDGVVESRDRINGIGGVIEEVDGLVEEDVKPIGVIRGVRDSRGNAHPVLNPVENLTQWKALKSKGAKPFKLQKENVSLEEEEPPRLSFSSDPSFKELSFSFKSKTDHEPKKLNREVSVDASLSNWLSSTETTPVKKGSICDASTPERSMLQGSNSVMSPEDRPILGALTVEEIKKFSASSSPRRSPSRSPDEMAIIGTVGTYWSHVSNTKDSGSPTSFKGIPNTTSKYREDKKVNWHSTPFETRLERALNRGGAA